MKIAKYLITGGIILSTIMMICTIICTFTSNPHATLFGETGFFVSVGVMIICIIDMIKD